MPIQTPEHTIQASASYTALRHGGAPAWRAQSELGLDARRARRLERIFQGRAGGGADPMKPAFADHESHVAAVLGAGGFPGLERRR